MSPESLAAVFRTSEPSFYFYFFRLDVPLSVGPCGLRSRVDEVILFDDETPLNLITSVMPDVLVKGSDYEGKAIAGADIVLSNGGRVVLSPFVEGYSTTNLVKKVKQI